MCLHLASLHWVPCCLLYLKSVFLYREVARVSQFCEMFLAHHDDSEYWTYACMHREGWNWVYLEKAEHCAPRWSHIGIKRLRTFRDLLPFRIHPQTPEFPALSAVSELVLNSCFALDLSIRSCHDNIFVFLCFSLGFWKGLMTRYSMKMLIGRSQGLQVCSKMTFMASSPDLWLMFFPEKNCISWFILEKFIRIITLSPVIC